MINHRQGDNTMHINNHELISEYTNHFQEMWKTTQWKIQEAIMNKLFIEKNNKMTNKLMKDV